MILAVVFFTVLTEASAAPDPDLGYAGLSFKTTQSQLLARYPNARHDWRPADGSRGWYYEAVPADEKTFRAVKRGSPVPFEPVRDWDDRKIISDFAAAGVGEYSIANNGKDRRGVDSLEARMKRGEIRSISFLVNRSCEEVIAELSAAYGPPNLVRRRRESASRVWHTGAGRMTVTCLSTD